MITVAVLFVVGAGMRETGAVDLIRAGSSADPKRRKGQLPNSCCRPWLQRLHEQHAAGGNVDPAVTIGRANRIAVSKLLIPLSYAAILGGTCTLIGTSTNLVVQGMLIKAMPGTGGMGMFDISWVGIPAAIVGGTFILATSRWLLPDRQPALSTLDDSRQTR